LAVVIRVEHELHTRRRGRNMGLLAVLLGFVVIVFGLTVAKVQMLGDARKFESFDHVARPQIVTDDAAPAEGSE
jgi:hypothetical protein